MAFRKSTKRSTQNARNRRKRRSTYKKNTRPAVRRRVRRPTRRANLSRTKVMEMITVPNTSIYQTGFTAVPLDNASGLGKACIYTSGLVCLPDQDHLIKIASTIRPTITNTDMKYHLTQQLLTYEYSNMSIGTCYLTAYFCKVRNNLPYSNSISDPVAVLKDGFANRGLDISNRGQVGVISAQLDPFSSPKFCTNFNIYKVLSKKLGGGQSGRLSVKNGTKHTVKMSNVVNQTAATQTTFAECGRLFAYQTGTKFILFKIEGEVTTGANDTPTYTKPRVQFIANHKYVWRYVSDDNSSLYVNTTTSVTVPPTLATVVTDKGQVKSSE